MDGQCSSWSLEISEFYKQSAERLHLIVVNSATYDPWLRYSPVRASAHLHNIPRALCTSSSPSSMSLPIILLLLQTDSSDAASSVVNDTRPMLAESF